MVFDPTTHQMLNASKPSAGRAKKRGGFRRRKSSRGNTLGQPQGEGAPSDASASSPDVAKVAPEGPAPQHVYNDERVQRAAKNAKLRALSYPVAIAVGGGTLFGGITFGLESWVAAIVASIVATLTYKVIDSRVR